MSCRAWHWCSTMFQVSCVVLQGLQMWNCGEGLLIDSPGHRAVSAGSCVPVCGLNESDFNCIFKPRVSPAFMMSTIPSPSPVPAPGN